MVKRIKAINTEVSEDVDSLCDKIDYVTSDLQDLINTINAAEMNESEDEESDLGLYIQTTGELYNKYISGKNKDDVDWDNLVNDGVAGYKEEIEDKEFSDAEKEEAKEYVKNYFFESMNETKLPAKFYIELNDGTNYEFTSKTDAEPVYNAHKDEIKSYYMSVIDPKTKEIIFNRDLHAEKLAESEEDELDAEQQEELNKAIELYKLHGMLFLDDEDGKNAYEVLYNAGYTLKKSGDVASCIELNKLVESDDTKNDTQLIEEIKKSQEEKISRLFNAECNIKYFSNTRTSKDVFYGMPLLCISINKMATNEKGELWRYNKGSIGYDVEIYPNSIKVKKYQPKEQGDITCSEVVKTIDYDTPNNKLEIVKQAFNIIDLVKDVIDFDMNKQPVKEDFDEDLFEAIIEYANEQGVNTTDLFESDYEAIADYVSEKLGRPVSAATVEEAIVMDYDDSMDLDEELDYKYDDEISTFKPGSIQYKKLEQAAKMIQDRLGIIVKVDDTWFDYGQRWMWTTLLGEDPDGIIYDDSSAWQLIYPPQQKEIIFGDINKAVDDICKHYEERIAENSNKSSDVNESSDNSASSAVRSNISIKDFNKLVEDLDI